MHIAVAVEILLVASALVMLGMILNIRARHRRLAFLKKLRRSSSTAEPRTAILPRKPQPPAESSH